MTRIATMQGSPRLSIEEREHLLHVIGNNDPIYNVINDDGALGVLRLKLMCNSNEQYITLRKKSRYVDQVRMSQETGLTRETISRSGLMKKR